jgi:hypothetical protein
MTGGAIGAARVVRIADLIVVRRSIVVLEEEDFASFFAIWWGDIIGPGCGDGAIG